MDDFAILVGRDITDSDDAAIWFGSRRADLNDFSLKAQGVAWTHRSRPLQFVDAQTDGAAGQLKIAGDKQFHRHRGGVPAARGQAAKDASLCRVQIEMERLRIELLCEIDNVLLGHVESAGLEAIADVQVFQEFLGHGVTVGQKVVAVVTTAEQKMVEAIESSLVMLSEVEASDSGSRNNSERFLDCVLLSQNSARNDKKDRGNGPRE